MFVIGLAKVKGDRGENDQAYDDALRAVEMAREVGYWVLEGQALTALATIRFGQGQLDHARSYGERKLFDEIGAPVPAEVADALW